MKSFIKLFNVFFNRKSIIILTLATMLISISSCASDDEPEVDENTFLTKFNGEKWETFQNGIFFTFIFHDDLLNPFSYWQQEADDGCYYFLEPFDLGFEILELTDDAFAVRFTVFDGQNYRNTTLRFFVNENDNIQEGDTLFTKTDKIYVICDD